MKIRIVGSSVGGGDPQQFLLSYVVDGAISIDAGCIGLMSPLADQSRIRHVFLSHSHIDHISSLPCFLDNVYAPGPECVTLYGHAATLESLRTDFFNDRIWPDLVRLSAEETPFLKLVPLSSEQSVSVEGVTVTPVELDHVVPTFGYLISSGPSTVAIISDTAPSQRVWEVANAAPQLKAVFLEVSFPDSMAWLAEKTKHLTPLLFRDEIAKLTRPVDVIAVHIKPAFRAQVIQELEALKLPRLCIGESEGIYEF